MKKTLCIFNLFIIVSCFLFAEDYKLEKIIEFKQGKFEEGLYIRKNEEVAPYDDFTAQYINFDKNGSLYFFQNDSARIIKLSNSSIEEKCQIKGFEKWPCDLFYGEDYFIISGMGDGCHKFSFNGKRLFEVHISSFIGKFTEIKSFYYDEETDILFLQDKNDQLYSIINPGLNEEQNKKNFKTPEETLAMLNEGKYAPHLEIREELNWQKKSKNYLYIDGKRERWGKAYEIGKYICSVIPEDHYINLYDGKNRVEAHYELPNGEQLESNAFHPCGDVYFLTMNWTTNTHNLYRIENTWDPEWREQWYKEHPEAE